MYDSYQRVPPFYPPYGASPDPFSPLPYEPYSMAYANPFFFGCVKDPFLPYRFESSRADALNSLYPQELKDLKAFVKKECDRLDYPGSMIYDECPDRVDFQRHCSRICDAASSKCQYGKECKDREHLMDIIRVLFAHEIYERRNQSGRKF